ncbi:PEP/pyruvate-binding domain-containing protein [Acidobacteriota bacterium]
MLDWLKKLFSPSIQPDPDRVQELRIAFKARFHQFKLLLNANNQALEIMTEIEEALRGIRPFGMTFVRERCTRISTNVFQIVKHLNELAPDKYEALYSRFEDIRQKINPHVFPETPEQAGPLVVPLREVNRSHADLVGGKTAYLGDIGSRLRLKIPAGFVITSCAYNHFMEHNDLPSEINRRIQATPLEQMDQRYALSAAIQQLIISASIPADLQAAIAEHYRLLEEEAGKEVMLAIRSSALGEDAAGASFAGQYRSELNVSGEHILHAYKEIVASKYSLSAMSYRLNRGIKDEDIAMSVGCMSMVGAVSGGVLYTRNPINIRDDAIVINAAWGLPKAVVDGRSSVDTFYIGRGEPPVVRQREIRKKESKFVNDPHEGIQRIDVTEEESRKACLTDVQILDLTGMAIKIEKYYQAPQDIEWAIGTDGTITLLQCRPLRQHGPSEGETGGDRRVSAPRQAILRGEIAASSGAAAGRVFIARRDMDALRFPEKAVLVTAQSLPHWATLLNRASALVAEQGSLACHLANVAREYGVPALFAVKGALDTLQDDQLITVDADGLGIYDGRIEEILKIDSKPRNFMEGSPVYEALTSAAQHIVPLTLLDPAALTFMPEHCKTLHDITRYCHEKSVSEMFRFGKDHSFPERSSKQLVCEVPMQWWILNLDDGYAEEVDGRQVRLENIVSIPMLALWEGIIRFPWEGPPSVDGKGFMSIMFEATRNRSLIPGAPSHYGNRNYFMISKNYCSFTSRLGFHFSMVEALVTERATENYVSFQFKGGAADYDRRLKRVMFVRDILEENGFRVDVREDNLIARLEGQPMDVMEKNLQILGYLTIHTRQLDMIMSNEASVNYYRAKISENLAEIVNQP